MYFIRMILTDQKYHFFPPTQTISFILPNSQSRTTKRNYKRIDLYSVLLKIQIRFILIFFFVLLNFFQVLVVEKCVLSFMVFLLFCMFVSLFLFFTFFFLPLSFSNISALRISNIFLLITIWQISVLVIVRSSNYQQVFKVFF